VTTIFPDAKIKAVGVPVESDGLKVKPAVKIHGGNDVSESGNDAYSKW
jgi:hypothetical protein